MRLVELKNYIIFAPYFEKLGFGRNSRSKFGSVAQLDRVPDYGSGG